MKPYFFTFLIAVALFELFSLMPGTFDEQDRGPFRVGAIHVHSTYSDGGGSVEEIASDAITAGLDFVVLTDHNTIQARREGKEKRYQNMDLLVESEISTLVGHALAFYTHTPGVNIPDNQIRDRTDKHYQGQPIHPDAFLAMAHPNNVKNPWNRLDKYTKGIEVFNFDSFWQRQLYSTPISFLFTASLYPLNSYLTMLRFFRPDQKNLDQWDQMNSTSGGHFGLLAPDTHSRVVLKPGIEFRWPSYLQTFRMAANAIRIKGRLKEDFAARKRQLYDALRAGRNAMVFHLIHPFGGNDWTLKCANDVHTMGEQVPFSTDCNFVVNLPKTLPYAAQLKLLRDGEVVVERRTLKTRETFQLNQPGVYRLEVWVKPRSPLRIVLRQDVPYVFYNPIYVVQR